ncbi:hypothetical protein, partial [Alloalcanivorax balearicus]|uniref:hypothetical protein n=1 Tax=Alloalcanivorax balearicus TaxID=413232 RepID=UPI0021CDA2C7
MLAVPDRGGHGCGVVTPGPDRQTAGGSALSFARRMPDDAPPKSLFMIFTPPRCCWKSRQAASRTAGFGGAKVKGRGVVWRLFQRNP